MKCEAFVFDSTQLATFWQPLERPRESAGTWAMWLLLRFGKKGCPSKLVPSHIMTHVLMANIACGTWSFELEHDRSQILRSGPNRSSTWKLLRVYDSHLETLIPTLPCQWAHWSRQLPDRNGNLEFFVIRKSALDCLFKEAFRWIMKLRILRWESQDSQRSMQYTGSGRHSVLW